MSGETEGAASIGRESIPPRATGACAWIALVKLLACKNKITD